MQTTAPRTYKTTILNVSATVTIHRDVAQVDLRGRTVWGWFTVNRQGKVTQRGQMSIGMRNAFDKVVAATTVEW